MIYLLSKKYLYFYFWVVLFLVEKKKRNHHAYECHDVTKFVIHSNGNIFQSTGADFSSFRERETKRGPKQAREKECALSKCRSLQQKQLSLTNAQRLVGASGYTGGPGVSTLFSCLHFYSRSSHLIDIANIFTTYK